MGNEESMMAEGGGGHPQANGMPGGLMPGGPGGQAGTQGPNLGGIGLGSLSNIGSSITNTIKNQASQATAGAGGLSNLASLGSNLTNNLTNQAKNLASNLDNIGSNLTKDLTQPGGPSGPLIGGLSKAATNLSAAGQPKPPARQAKSDVPDVDLGGLIEEEKAMIQSVMMRAQETEAPGGMSQQQKQQLQQQQQQQQQQQLQQYQMGQPQQQLDPMGTSMIQRKHGEDMKSQMNQHQSAFSNQMMGEVQPSYDTTNMPQPNMMGDMNQLNKLQQDSGTFANQGLMQQQQNQQQQTVQQAIDQSLQQQQPQKPKDIFCPVCRISILMPSSEIENKCVDCSQVVCKNCGMNAQSQFNEKSGSV